MAALPSAAIFRAALAGLCAVVMTSAASAQTMNTNSASFNAGWGRTADQENRPVEFSARDANGNLVILDGIIEHGQDQSVFATAGAGGAIDTVSGVGALGGSTALGNNLVVVTQGSNNTVIVNSQQTNTGNVSAGAVLNGGVANVP